MQAVWVSVELESGGRMMGSWNATVCDVLNTRSPRNCQDTLSPRNRQDTLIAQVMKLFHDLIIQLVIKTVTTWISCDNKMEVNPSEKGELGSTKHRIDILPPC
jgi:hypothetical protein